MKSPVKKHSVVVAGRKTTLSLENDFWEPIKEIAKLHGWTASHLVSRINAGSNGDHLSSAVRVFVLEYYQKLMPPTVERKRAPAMAEVVDKESLHKKLTQMHRLISGPLDSVTIDRLKVQAADLERQIAAVEARDADAPPE